jgi:hypothetical protein
MTIQSVVTGKLGERLVFNKLRNLGRVRVPKLQHCGDIHIEGIKIEVKTSQLTQVNQHKRGWQWKLFQAHKTDFRHSDILILLGLNESQDVERVYIIPCDVLGDTRKKINVVRNSTTTKWYFWQDRWDILEAAIAENDLSGFDFEQIEPIEF